MHRVGRRHVGYRSADGDDGWPKFGVRRQHAMIPVPMDARGWDESSQALKKLERGEQKFSAPVWRRPWKPVQEPGVR